MKRIAYSLNDTIPNRSAMNTSEGNCSTLKEYSCLISEISSLFTGQAE